jgi:hypothetical protein
MLFLPVPLAAVPFHFQSSAGVRTL